MRWRLAASPWWVQGLLYGTFFGAWMTVFSRYQTGRWLVALGGGVVGGAFFGVTMGLLMSRASARVVADLEGFSPFERRVVARASWRGPVPEDPRLRAAARSLLERRRDQVRRTRRLSLVVFPVFVLLYVVMAITRSWWWWLAAVAFVGFLVLTLTTPARLDRRLTLLGGGTPRTDDVPVD